MNTTVYVGKDTKISEVIDLAETLPFLAEKRLIILEDTDCAKNSCEELAKYIPNIPESTVIMMVENEVDKRNQVYKAFGKFGSVVEFTLPDESDLKMWILSKLKKEGKTISTSAYGILMERAGDNMQRLSQELEKLICYVGERNEINVSDVDALVVKQTEIKVFDMVRNVAFGNKQEALSIYYEMLAAKEPPMRILFNLGRQFNQMYMTKQLKMSGFSSKQIADMIGIRDYFVNSLLKQVARFDEDELKSAIKECVELEEAVKTGKLDGNMSVELFIIKYSAKK